MTTVYLNLKILLQEHDFVLLSQKTVPSQTTFSGSFPLEVGQGDQELKPQGKSQVERKTWGFWFFGVFLSKIKRVSNKRSINFKCCSTGFSH